MRRRFTPCAEGLEPRSMLDGTPIELVDIVPDPAPPDPVYTMPDYGPFGPNSAPVGVPIADPGPGAIILGPAPAPAPAPDPDPDPMDPAYPNEDPYVEATPVQPVDAGIDPGPPPPPAWTDWFGGVVPPDYPEQYGPT